MQLHQEWWLLRQRQHTLLHHSALDIVVLDDDVFLQDLDGEKIVGALSLGQHHLAEGALAQHHQEIEVGGANQILFGHVVRQVLVECGRCSLCDGCFLHVVRQRCGCTVPISADCRGVFQCLTLIWLFS